KNRFLLPVPPLGVVDHPAISRAERRDRLRLCSAALSASHRPDDGTTAQGALVRRRRRLSCPLSPAPTEQDPERVFLRRDPLVGRAFTVSYERRVGRVSNRDYHHGRD